MKKNKRYFIFGILFTIGCYWAYGHFKSDLVRLNAATKNRVAQVSNWL